MREFRSSGSVEGVMGNHDFYSDWDWSCRTSVSVRRFFEHAKLWQKYTHLC